VRNSRGVADRYTQISASGGAMVTDPQATCEQRAHDERRDGDGQQRAEHQRDRNRQPLVREPVQVRHHADPGRHEQQRQVPQQAVRSVAQVLGDGAAHHQGDEQQRHANDGARDRESERDDGDSPTS